MKIAAFPHIVFRTPYFALNAYNTEELVKSPIFDEALLLASPDLYAKKNKIQDKNEKNNGDKLQISLNKYASRAMTRCTPFGLFAGCSLATIGESTEVQLQNQENYQRSTGLDMQYLCTLVQQLEKEKTVREQLKYYPNDSLYEFGNKLRYAEYFYRGLKRIHTLSGIESSDFLKNILNLTIPGSKIKELAQLITDEEISQEEASEFIHELIDNQILKSELELAVTGNENLLLKLINQLKPIKGIDTIKLALNNIYNFLKKIDQTPPGISIPIYKEIITHIEATGIAHDARFLFQTDLFKPVRQAEISQAMVNNIMKGLTFLNKISTKPRETDISQFKEAFYARYEERKVPLLEVLDKELGIGYPINTNNGGQSHLLAGIIRPKIYESKDTVLDYWGKIMLKKYVTALQKKQNIIELSDDDVKGLKADWKDLPPTFSCMCQLINENEIYISSAGGESATKLLGRFCHLNKQIKAHVQSIADKEQASNEDVIYAEIVHLPESRMGNILFRPVLRKYEIPYLCKAGTGSENIIPLKDLMLSVKNGHLFISSKRLNKEIIPCLSTAHNFRHNSMPVYHFLCDMQHAAGRKGVFFSWGATAEVFDYLPRVIYKNCILSRARWKIKKEKLQEWSKLTDHVALDKINEYRKLKNIPEKIIIPDGDNELFIDFTNQLSIQTFLSMIKKRDRVVIEEFLFDKEQTIVKSKEGAFCNQFIFSFYKTPKTTIK